MFSLTRIRSGSRSAGPRRRPSRAAAPPAPSCRGARSTGSAASPSAARRLVVAIGAGALDQPEALRVLVEEGGDLQRLGVLHRAPDRLAPAVADLATVDLVGASRASSTPRRSVGTEQEGAGHAGDADMLERRARDTVASMSTMVASPGRRVMRSAAVADSESTRAWITICPVPAPGRSSQKARKQREFLALRLGGLQREGAGGDAVSSGRQRAPGRTRRPGRSRNRSAPRRLKLA